LPKPDKIVGQIESGLTGVYCNFKSATFATKLRTRRDETRVDNAEHPVYI